MPTIQTNGPWTWCVRENSTYLDCPVSEQTPKANITISAYNPAASPMDFVSIIVKTPHYTVQTYNHSTGTWVVADTDRAAIICENETLANGFSINSCILHVNYVIEGHQVGLLQLTYDTNSTLFVDGTVSQTATFSSYYETVTLNGYDSDKGHHFTIAKKNYQQSFEVYADLRYWPGFGNEDEQSSGAYIFRVNNGTTQNIRYSQFQGCAIYESAVINQITFYYFNA